MFLAVDSCCSADTVCFVCMWLPLSGLFAFPPAGYRCFKAVLFLTGLMFGSVVIFMLCYKERVMDTQLSVEASVGIGLGIGTLCGLVTMLVRSVGLFMVGLLLGLLVGVASLVVRTFILQCLDWCLFANNLQVSCSSKIILGIKQSNISTGKPSVLAPSFLHCPVCCLLHCYVRDWQTNGNFRHPGEKNSHFLTKVLKERGCKICHVAFSVKHRGSHHVSPHRDAGKQGSGAHRLSKGQRKKFMNKWRWRANYSPLYSEN